MFSDSDRIIHDLCSGSFTLTRHAKERMAERRVRFEDIRHCAETVEEIKEQGDGKFLIVGRDFDDDELKIVAAWDGDTVVITVIGD